MAKAAGYDKWYNTAGLDIAKTEKKGKYAEYYLAFAAHYIGDLSQPLHNTYFDAFNKSRHLKNDGTVEDEVLANISTIEKGMYEVEIRTDNIEQDTAREIARIANISRELGLLMRKEDRDITKDEAYAQLAHSASLFKAVLKAIGKVSDQQTE